MSDFNRYQEFTASLAVYNENVFYEVQGLMRQAPWTYPVHALAEEAGEVNGKIAKYIRKHGDNRLELRELVSKELGDVLYQVSETARQFGLSLQEVVDTNMEKLTDRAQRGVLVGEGDER